MTTQELLSEFKRAQVRILAAQCELDFARTDFANAQNALGERLVPADAADGERCGIWQRDQSGKEEFLFAVRSSDRSYKVDVVRPRPV